MDIDFGIVADRIVKDCLRLGKKDSLGVHTGEHMLPLAKEIVKAARREGADTVITLDSDDIWYDALLNLPVEWLKSPSALSQAFQKASTAIVSMEGPQDPTMMREIPRDRWAANEVGAEATYKPFEDKLIPTVELGISRVTEARARAYGFDYDEWYRSTMQALAVDPKSIRRSGEMISKAFSKAKKGRLTAPGGTDFTFDFHGSAPAIHTGEIKPKKGIRSSYFTSLPDGAIYSALRKGSGKGRIVSTTPIPQAGRLIRGLKMDFKNGRIKNITAKENFDSFKLLYTEEKKRKGADQLGWLNIGLNSGAKYGFLNNNIVEGAIAIGIGDNEFVGGTNKSGYGFPVFFDDATLEVDGRKLVSNGRIVA